MDLILIRLVDMSFQGMFSDPHCRYAGPTGGSGFNQIGGHEFPGGCSQILIVHIQGLHVGLVLIRFILLALLLLLIIRSEM